MIITSQYDNNFCLAKQTPPPEREEVVKSYVKHANQSFQDLRSSHFVKQEVILIIVCGTGSVNLVWFFLFPYWVIRLKWYNTI